jgi:glycosyltransferase involved in cell wall biosynthesis
VERDKSIKEFILFTSCNFPVGGPGATYVDLFCKGVRENAGKISVYLFKGYTYKEYKKNKNRKNHTDYGVRYTYLGFSNRSENIVLKISEDIFSILRTFGLMCRLIFKRKRIIILVYSNGLLFNAPVYFFSKIFGIKIISFVPEYLENENFKNQNFVQKLISYSFLINYNFLNTISDKLIVFSNFLRNEYINKNYRDKDIIVQPNLTQLKGWYAPQKIQYTIGYAGTPSKKDGIIDLIHAVKLLKEKGCLISVIIVGDSTNKDSLIPYFQKKCEELNISQQITFTGLVPQVEVKDYLNRCQILSVTRPDTKQTKAGFPTKLGEYMACKKIVLATKFGDIQEYFTDRENIILAEPDNPISIAENILWILNNSEKAEVIAKNGFKKANEVLNYTLGVKKIMNALN